VHKRQCGRHARRGPLAQTRLRRALAFSRNGRSGHRSLWDTTLRLPPGEPGPSEVHQHEVNGPGDARVLVAERSVLMTAGDQRVRVRAAVASDLARAAVAVKAFAKDLSVALGLFALVLAIATSIQVGLGLRPLACSDAAFPISGSAASGIFQLPCRAQRPRPRSLTSFSLKWIVFCQHSLGKRGYTLKSRRNWKSQELRFSAPSTS
jgi:hypothetical protein